MCLIWFFIDYSYGCAETLRVSPYINACLEKVQNWIRSINAIPGIKYHF